MSIESRLDLGDHYGLINKVSVRWVYSHGFDPRLQHFHSYLLLYINFSLFQKTRHYKIASTIPQFILWPLLYMLINFYTDKTYKTYVLPQGDKVGIVFSLLPVPS